MVARSVGNRSVRVLPWILCACALAVSGCSRGTGGGSVRSDRSSRPWNVLLVTFDTTRADHIGCYGNDRIRTPTLDRLAEEGVRFARALSAVPITAPSHSTILTGRYPIAHGVRDNGLFELGADQQTLAESLGSHGYATGAAIGSYPLTRQFGLDQGFDFFDDHLTGIFEDYRGERVVPKEELFFDERRAAQVNEAILPWLTERAKDPDDRPFFAWIHYFDAHQPQEPAPPFDQLYADDLYDGEIAYADSRLGFLLDRLEDLGELDHTLIVMTADHGEGLGEHDELTHAILAYDTTLHVPLIIRPPGAFAQHGTVVDHWVGTVDIVPTILDLLGIEAPESVQGHSLVPFWTEGRSPSKWTSIRYAENLSPRLTHGWGELRVLFEGSMKYIYGPEPQLFDLDADPHELHDLAAERPDEAERMKDHLGAFLERWAVPGASTMDTIDDDVRQRLESLGYLQGAGSGDKVVIERLRQDGVAPRRLVGGINNLSAAKQLLFQGQGPEALVYTQKLLDTSPDNPLYLELHVSALVQSGRLEEAWKMADRLASAGSLPEPLMLRLAASEFQGGNREAALDALRRYLGHDESARGEWLLATFRARMGDSREQGAALERALEIDPDYSPARVDLAVWYARAGDDSAAEREFRGALERSPYYPRAFYNYGTFLFEAERYADAAPYFDRAIALAPGYLAPRVALVAAYLGAGKRDEAEAAFGDLERLAPGSSATAQAAEILAAP